MRWRRRIGGKRWQHEEVSAYGNGGNSSFTLESPITLKSGENEIALLSMTVGLQTAGPFYEWTGAGLTSVKISGLKNGTVDLSSNTWIYKIGLEGEHKNIHRADTASKVKWISNIEVPKNQPLTWYKTTILPPSGNDPVGLDMQYMGKGMAWLNGQHIGRYWPRSSINDGCSPSCNYRGKFFPSKCNMGCGEPTQRWYHVPRSWFQPSGNILVIFEEKGGDPTKIKISRRHTTAVCGFVTETFPFELASLVNGSEGREAKADLLLSCPSGSIISEIRFASFGTPGGSCGSYSQGTCHYPNSVSIIQQACLNKRLCVISLLEKFFGKDLCPGTIKTLAVEAACR